ncbi:MAG: hypothetical protein KJ834_11410 [Alphaproteobacteria bacterium]|nr:hypothetical protein [Alphaproteobacteria bacterium]
MRLILMRLTTVLASIFTIHVSGPLLAADYYWVTDNAKTGSNPTAACNLGFQLIAAQNGYDSHSNVSYTATSASSGYCEAYMSYAGSTFKYSNKLPVRRAGDSCPSGTEYDPSTGICDVPPGPVECDQNWSGGDIVYSDQLKQCVKYPNLPPEEFCEFMTGKDTGNTHLEATSGDASGPKSVAAPGTFCSVSVEKADCKMNTEGTYNCVVSGKYSGGFDPNADKAPGHCSTLDCETVPPEDPVPEPEVIKKDDPCIYSASGDKEVCHSSKSEEKEGTADCGVFNGVATCVTKQPSKNGIDIRTEVTKKILADGTTETTKKDVATITKCVAVKSCTTSQTTTTTTTKKDSNGNTTSVGSTCTGSACPDKNGNPDGNGDGLGDCTTGDGEFCGGGTGGDGDGSGGGVESPELEEVPEYADTVEGYFNRIKNAPIITAVTGITVPTGGSCPTYSASHEYFGSIDTGVFCDMGPDLLGMLKYLFLAMWAWVAIRTFMTA